MFYQLYQTQHWSSTWANKSHCAYASLGMSWSCVQACGLLQSQRFALYWVDHSTGVLLVLVCSSIVALSYNVIHSLMIQKTSAVTTTVLGEVKIVGLLLLSALLLGQPNTSYMLHTSACPLSAQAALSSVAQDPGRVHACEGCPVLSCNCSFGFWLFR